MKKLNLSNKPQTYPQSIGKTSEPIDKVFYRLKELHEIQDESRNELCPVLHQEQQPLRDSQESEWGAQQYPTQVNILKDLEQMDGMTRRTKQQYLISTKPSYNSNRNQDLSITNLKLKEDNAKLLGECIRLRKQCVAYQQQIKQLSKATADITNNKERALEKELQAVRYRAQEVMVRDKQLQQKVETMREQLRNANIFVEKYWQKETEARKLQEIIAQMNQKILVLDKQNEVNRNGSSKSISLNNTTQESRKTEIDKDRMIANMKIVHQSETRKLKSMIDDLKKQLSKSGQSLSSSSSSLFKKKGNRS